MYCPPVRLPPVFSGHPRSRRIGLDGRVLIEVLTDYPPGVAKVAVGDHVGLDGTEPRWFAVVKVDVFLLNPVQVKRLLLLLRESSYPERLAWGVMTA
jgi:hypothetical protein